ncbi:MAG: hypothetical protein BBJ57_07350 [Desulfobacterales bacterium PC51MH44]|nr:MAG: hypothetical protein BBJ57_07350 [Desulfobacterales bacterium PC51MH44]
MFNESPKEMSLTNISEGQAVEKFDDALERVLRDIRDPNTSEKFRTITMTVKVAPVNEGRTLVSFNVGSPVVKYPQGSSLITQATLTLNDKGKPVAREIPQRQEQLPFKKVIEGGFNQE